MKTFLTLAVMSFLSVPAFAIRFTFDDPLQRDSVVFQLNAPLESIEGRSSRVKGSLDLFEDDLEKSKGGEFTLPLRGFTTGIGLRDQHMFDTYLNADRFPDIKLIVTKIESAERGQPNAPQTIKAIKLTEKQPARVILKGELLLHGVRREVRIPTHFTYYKETNLTQSKLRGNLLVVRSNFDIHLEDFLIHRPHVVSMQVGDTAHINAFLTGTSQSQPSVKNPPESATKPAP